MPLPSSSQLRLYAAPLRPPPITPKKNKAPPSPPAAPAKKKARVDPPRPHVCRKLDFDVVDVEAPMHRVHLLNAVERVRLRAHAAVSDTLGAESLRPMLDVLAHTLREGVPDLPSATLVRMRAHLDGLLSTAPSPSLSAPSTPSVSDHDLFGLGEK